MKFTTEAGAIFQNEPLNYRNSEYSFDFDSPPNGAAASVVVNDLELKIGSNGQVLYVCGFCPHTAWQKTDLDAPPSTRRVLRLIDWPPKLFELGVVRLTRFDEWPMYFDRRRELVCVGDPSARGQLFDATEFAAGVFAVIRDGDLKALWLRASFCETVP